jgi:uncharacterized membrane protein YkvA (DUF1232 family)
VARRLVFGAVMPRAVRVVKRAPVKAAKRAQGQSYLQPGDFQRYLQEKAMLIAPGDVEPLVAQRDQVVAKIERDCGDHDLLRRQLHLAIDLLRDHATERIPQIPYHTIGVLTAAVLYFMNPVDVIPDFIAGVGTSDDALLLEMAFEMTWPGIERYCISKGKPLDGLRSAIKKNRRRPR